MCANGALGECVCARKRIDEEPAKVVRNTPLPRVAPGTAQVTAKGVRYVILRSGSGTTRPNASNRVEVHYEIWNSNGKQIDSSRKRGRTFNFRFNQVIPGFSDVIANMVVGDMVRAWVPPRLGYKNRPGRPQGTLVFEIELIAIR